MATPAVLVLRSKTLRRGIVAAILAPMVAGLMLVVMAIAALASIFFGGGSTTGAVSSSGTLQITFSSSEPAQSAYALAHIPATQSGPSVVSFPILYAAATANGRCVMPWPLLAGVTNQESSFGTSRAPGVHGGRNAAGAEGPFQFEPATFAGYANPIPDFPGAARPPTPYDAVDAAFAAARKLCANGILTNPKLALWTYNAGGAGISYVLVNGVLTVVYNQALFAHSSDNPAKYVLDVLAFAARAGSGTISGSGNLTVTGLAPGAGNIGLERRRSALWMHLLASGNCQQLVQSSCFAAMPTILNSYDGITLPSDPSQMRQDLVLAQTPLPGDIVLFGDSKTIYGGVYGVVANQAGNQIAVVSSEIEIIQLSQPLTVGSRIGGRIVRFIGSPFG